MRLQTAAAAGVISSALLLTHTAAAKQPLCIGHSQVCAVLDDSTVKCWGSNSDGQLGQGDHDDRGDELNEMGDQLSPVDLGTGRTAASVACGGDHSCALLDHGSLKCWGYNGYGQLGQGHTNTIGDAAGEMGDSLPVVDLGTGRTASSVTSGCTENFTCVILDDGSVKCWGENNDGQLGQGDTDTRVEALGDDLPPIDLGLGRTAVALSGGERSACALLDNSSVKCWGNNNTGQLGQGDTSNRGDEPNEMGDNLPAVDLGSGRTAVAISSYQSHACALLDNGTVKCWGENSYGQLGQGDTMTRGNIPNQMGDNLPPIDLGSGRTATAIACGERAVCAILDNHSLKCWGSSDVGQLGQGDTMTRGDNPNEMGDNLPTVDLGSGQSALAVAGGRDAMCAVLDNGSVKCWGGNDSGELGQGDTQDRGDNAGEMGDALLPINLGTDRTVPVPVEPTEHKDAASKHALFAGLLAGVLALLNAWYIRC